MELKITVVKHRKKMCFRWFVDRKARFRVIKNLANVQAEEIQLRVDLRTGETQESKHQIAKQQQKTLAETHKVLAGHIDDFFQDIATVSSKQAALVRQRVERVLAEAGIKTLGGITLAKIRTAISRLRCTVRNPRKKPEDYPLISEQSRHHYQRAIKQFMRFLDDEGRLTDPLRKWKLKKVVEERNPRDRLQPDELAALVKATNVSTRIIEGYDGSTRAWLYLIASMTGLRRGEIAALVPCSPGSPGSFNLATRTVTVAAQDTKGKKTANLPLNRAMVPDLKKWLAGKRRGPLFPGLADKRTHKMIKLDLEAIGLPYKTDVGARCFHGLRNTYISTLFEAGLTSAQVQRRARHGDIRQTMRYAKPRADEVDLIDKLDYPGLT